MATTPFITSAQADKKIQDSYSALEQQIDIANAGSDLGLLKVTDTPPPTGKHRGDVQTEGTYTNFGGIVFTQLELDNNYGYIYVDEGVSSKILSAKKLPELVQTIDPSGTTKATSEKSVADYTSNFIEKDVSFSNNILDFTLVHLDRQISTTGVETDSASFHTSEFFNVEPNTIYSAKVKGSSVVKVIRRVVFFDVNKVHISGLDGLLVDFTTPVNSYYCRVMFLKGYSTFSVVKGSIPFYEDYKVFTDFKVPVENSYIDENSIVTKSVLEKIKKTSGKIRVSKIGGIVLIRTKFNSSKDLIRTILLNGSQNLASNLSNTRLIDKEATIDSDGYLLHPIVDSMPGPLKINSKTDSPFYLNVGGNHGMMTTTDANSPAHGKTSSDLLSTWIDPTGAEWYIGNIIDLNNVRLISKPINIGGYDKIKSKPTSPLTHVSGAVNQSQLNFTGNAYEFKPISNNVDVRLYVDNVEIINDGDYFADIVKVIDNHSVPDPTEPVLTNPYSVKNNLELAKNTIICTFYNNNVLSVESILNSNKNHNYENYSNIRPEIMNAENYSNYKTYAMNVGTVLGSDFENGIDFKNTINTVEIKKSNLKEEIGIKSISSILGNSDSEIGMNVSYNPLVGFGKSEYILLWDNQFSIRSTKKIYPIGVQGDVNENVFNGIEYLTYWDASVNPKLATDFYVQHGNYFIYFISIKEELNKGKINIASELIGKDIEIIYKSIGFVFNTEDYIPTTGLILSGNIGDWCVFKVL